jgi:hypothetical protein
MIESDGGERSTLRVDLSLHLVYVAGAPNVVSTQHLNRSDVSCDASSSTAAKCLYPVLGVPKPRLVAEPRLARPEGKALGGELRGSASSGMLVATRSGRRSEGDAVWLDCFRRCDLRASSAV